MLDLLRVVVAQDTCYVGIVFGIAVSLVALTQGGIAGFGCGEDVGEVGHCVLREG